MFANILKRVLLATEIISSYSEKHAYLSLIKKKSIEATS